MDTLLLHFCMPGGKLLDIAFFLCYNTAMWRI